MMDSELESEVTRNVLKRVRQLEIRTNRLLDEHLLGSYRSIFKGQGIDFEEVREYIAGDDVRAIDWNITARTGRPFIKKFREDRELTVILAVDVSGSLDFGSHYYSKREVITELASLLAFSATRNHDKVGLLLFSDQVEKFVPPEKGKRHVLRVVRDLLFYEPKRLGTDLVGTLRYLNNITKKRAIIFLFSDFLQTKKLEDLTRSLEVTNRRHDLVCIKIEDDRERILAGLGRVTLMDAETGELVTVNTSDRSFQERYSKQRMRYEQGLGEHLKRSGIDFLKLQTNGTYLQIFDQFLRKRARLR